MRFVSLLLALQFGCASVPELEPVQAPEPENSADCDDCWNWCGDAGDRATVTYCNFFCSWVCA